MDEATLKAVLVEIFAALNVTHAGRAGDAYRWAASDLATDLAPLLHAALRAVIPTPRRLGPVHEVQRILRHAHAAHDPDDWALVSALCDAVHVLLALVLEEETP